MLIEQIIKAKIVKAVFELYAQEISQESVQLQNTRKDVDGDITVVVFPFLRFSKKSPEQTASDLGTFLKEQVDEVSDFSVIKGFLNLSISLSYWMNVLDTAAKEDAYGIVAETDESPLVMIEYSSPNTNKPLHLSYNFV